MLDYNDKGCGRSTVPHAHDLDVGLLRQLLLAAALGLPLAGQTSGPAATFASSCTPGY